MYEGKINSRGEEKGKIKTHKAKEILSIKVLLWFLIVFSVRFRALG
jgi:hypothetical protein